MTGDADDRALDEARRLRDAARANVHTGLTTLRDSLTERPLARRVTDRIATEVTETLDSGVELARESKGVIALTLAALLGWLFRRQLGSAAYQVWTRARQQTS